MEENSLWKPPCAAAKVLYVAAKWQQKNVGGNAHCVFIPLDCFENRQLRKEFLTALNCSLFVFFF